MRSKIHSTSKIYVDRNVLVRTDRLIVPRGERVANFQVDREQARSRGTFAAQIFARKIACKTLMLVFASRCFQTKLYGAISTTIDRNFRCQDTTVSENRIARIWSNAGRMQKYYRYASRDSRPRLAGEKDAERERERKKEREKEVREA